MDIRNQRICAWSVPLFMVFLGIGFAVLGRYIPPPSPEQSAASIVRFYARDTNLIRLGLVLTMVGAALLVPWVVVFAHQLRRVEGPSGVLAQTQMLAGAMVVILIVIPTMLWTAAAYRPERSPDIVLALNDIGWFFFILAFSLPVVQMLAIALAILGAPDETVFPRWVGYLNLWLAILLAPGAIVTFVKHGVFAWNGLIGWWLTIVDFGIFWTVNTIVLFRAISQEAQPTQRTTKIATPATT